MVDYLTCKGCILLGVEYEKSWPDEAINWACGQESGVNEYRCAR